MVTHIVLIKFSGAVTDAQVDKLIDKTLKLKDEIPGIIEIQQGRNFSNRSQGYDVGMTVKFENKQALENFGPHPKHQEVVAYLKNELGLEDIIVVDF
ncbi:Dabb family protein [Desertibacillus haloalkaliphilus]|uniref:Dabb family protein n=1 Tax=Desertibacillus haloalkaliphilus TaxID=1328930 RepID=UPI001C255D66|nr:Dabb family protein [Desertibacillus haloalkaliphilus]MBU8905439.1 Dabb family protein [Desertibacillus haloalkaliphilus]